MIEVGGLARADQAGYGEEFTRVAKDLFGTDGSHAAQEAAAVRGKSS
ncbi:hypothetical protein AB0I53_24520 [Saccharopolyspora sp. NPDC050389]